MKRKIALVLAAVVAAVSLAGCNNNQELLDKIDELESRLDEKDGISRPESSSQPKKEENNSQGILDIFNPPAVQPEETFTEEDIENSKKWLTIKTINQNDVVVGCSEEATKVVIPDGVIGIANEAFMECTNLKAVKIPNSVTGIGEYAFYDCTGLTSINIPDSVTAIHDYAFANCTGLKSYNVDKANPNYASIDGVLYNKDISFLYRSPEGKNGVVNIPDSVTKIGWLAFINCTGLKSINIPNSVTEIGNYAFSGCTGLTSINIPNSVTTIDSSAFNGCTGLKSITVDKSNPNYSSIDGVMCNKDTTLLIDCPEGKNGVVNIPNSVTEIGNYAFSGCAGLTSINIPNSVTEIFGGAFDGCTGLKSITVDKANPNYSSIDGVLYNKDITLVKRYPQGKNGVFNIPSSVTEIFGGAFYDCTGLTSINIPNSVTEISSSAFSGCIGLTSINIPNSVTKIGQWAFGGCTGLTSINIPNSVTEISGEAFGDCTSLTSITIPASVTEIGQRAFYDCEGLTSINIPNSVTEINEDAFEGCTGLKSITVDKSNPNYSSIDGVLYNKDITGVIICPEGKTGFFNIPNSVTKIGGLAFRDCTKLTSITIPNSVTKIGGRAFEGCTGLTSIKIPDSVTEIVEGAFYDCENISATYKGKTYDYAHIDDLYKAING